MTATYRPEAIPIHDAAPEPPESTLNPCGCDPAIGQECAICCPHPSRAGTIAAVGAMDDSDLPVQEYPPFMNREQEAKVDAGNILLEAHKITGGDRQNDYGTPEKNWDRISEIASAMCEMDLPPDVCVKVLIACKLARMITSPKKRDNYVDLAGYSHVLWRVVK